MGFAQPAGPAIIGAGGPRIEPEPDIAEGPPGVELRSLPPSPEAQAE
jgi:hypothetical protein